MRDNYILLAPGISARELPTPLTYHVVLITPEVARRLLETKAKNRAIRLSTVQRYARQMASGTWGLCTQPIVIRADGQMDNGQHRCSAVVASGITVAMVVCLHAPAESNEVTDIGAKRTAEDLLGIGAAKLSIVQAICGFRSNGRKVQLAPSELAEGYLTHCDAVDFAEAAVMKRGVRKISLASVAGVVARAFEAGVDRVRLARFTEVLLTGLYDDPADMAAVLARRVLTDEVGDRMRVPFATQLRKIERALQAFLRRERLTKLYAPEAEVYPFLTLRSLNGGASCDSAS